MMAMHNNDRELGTPQSRAMQKSKIKTGDCHKFMNLNAGCVMTNQILTPIPMTDSVSESVKCLAECNGATEITFYKEKTHHMHHAQIDLQEWKTKSKKQMGGGS